MLILSRKVGENIVLAETITVSVVSVEKGRVRIGITAPGNIHIVREELLHRDRAGMSTGVYSISPLEGAAS